MNDSTRPCSRVRQASTVLVYGSMEWQLRSMSKPLENARPAPVMISARTSVSAYTNPIAS